MANPMYPAKINSPKTELAATIAADATTIAVVDVTKLPAAPNLCTILNGDDSETFSYAAISGNNLTGCVRGLNGTAKAWTVGMKVARTYTAYDHDTFIEQVNEIVGKLVAASTTKAGLVQLSDATTSTATDRAATANAVKKSVDASTQALTDAKKYVDDKNWQKFALTLANGGYISIDNQNLNNYTASGFYAGGSMINAPDAGYYHVIIIGNGSNWVTQIAVSFFLNTLQIRRKADNIWQPWSRDVFSVVNNVIPGTGTPEGAVSASVGTMYLRLDGGTSTTLYIKEGGAAGNTGWKAK